MRFGTKGPAQSAMRRGARSKVRRGKIFVLVSGAAPATTAKPSPGGQVAIFASAARRRAAEAPP
jgi:hypothetical protein